ncbi:MAG: TlpA disulfide reductase family protein [Bacteroidetes bacterium]|nr:TlpA disulfide reductase family protein [Bacteroidota bacterium]
MKTNLLIVALFLVPIFLFSQEGEKKYGKLPSVTVKTLDGKNLNVSELSNNGKPMIISFWALWCKPCIKELTSISDVYPSWVEETGVKLVAVSIDDTRSSGRVQPVIEGKGWDYTVLLDPNGDFKRAMNIVQREIVWQHTSFEEGSELELIGLVRKLAKGEKLEIK